MMYSKTFYYRLAVVVDGTEKLTNIDEKKVLKHSLDLFVGNQTIKIEEQEVILRPIALDLMPKVQVHSCDSYLDRLSKVVERFEDKRVKEVLTDIRIWTKEAIKKYGCMDALGYLLQYLDEVEENEL